MPSGKKRKRHKMATHKRKKRLRKNRHKKKQSCDKLLNILAHFAEIALRNDLHICEGYVDCFFRNNVL